MRKLIGVLLGLGLIGAMGSSAHAVNLRGAKGISTITASATAVRLCLGPGAVYSVIVSTASSVQDFVVLRDTPTANTSSAVAVQVAPSATLINQVTFDPPLQFRRGISFNAPNTVLWTTVTYECGVINNGY